MEEDDDDDDDDDILNVVIGKGNEQNIFSLKRST